MNSDISICSMPGGLDLCERCHRNWSDEMLPAPSEHQSYIYPRKGVGTCQDAWIPGEQTSQNSTEKGDEENAT